MTGKTAGRGPGRARVNNQGIITGNSGNRGQGLGDMHGTNDDHAFGWIKNLNKIARIIYFMDRTAVAGDCFFDIGKQIIWN